ncbi:MAG: hypothetical protein RJA24_1871 [Pseudomonadota bacterium]
MNHSRTVALNANPEQGNTMFAQSIQCARRVRSTAAALGLLMATGFALSPMAAQAATSVTISGEISRITLTTPGDYWSAGTMVISGQYVTIPRNLLIDLAANRLTLWQFFDQAPAACKALGETGLTSTDRCNTSGTGAYASIAANRTNGGNIIAGDMLIDKGQEVVTGAVTYINHDDGYLRINGLLGDPDAGMMARMNDPTSRHTVQQGLGCAAGSPNCSADPRFTNDPDNYTNTAVTGFPMCIPSRVARTFVGLPAQGNDPTDPNYSPAVPAQIAQSGTIDPARGDVLCPDTNRPVTLSGLVNDSRFMAPIRLGDEIKLEGNFETVNGVRFLSFHSSVTEIALETRPALSQPDYVMPEEVEQDAPGYENLRARTLLIGFATRRPDVLLWTLHYDPVTNSRVEKPWASVRACDLIGGLGSCSANGLVPGVGGHIWKIRYNVDFARGAPKVEDNPCSNLRAEPRFGNPTQFCPVNQSTPEGSIAEQLAIVSPMPREIIARTGHRLAALAAGITPTTVDIKGAPATNGEYLVPLGVNLGGVGFPEWQEFDLTKMAWPFQFTGLPWTLDRRLSPGGCKDGVCEPTPQPLDPYPFEGVDPRLQARTLPTGPYNDPRFTAAPLSDARNRILSYVTPLNGTFDFNGNASVLAWPPIDPPTFAVAVTPAETFCASSTGSCATTVTPPVCSAPLVLRNGACMMPETMAPPPAPRNPPVVPVVTPVIAPPPVPVVTPVATPDTVTIEGVTWTTFGGNRGIMVVAKTSQPSGPVPTLFVTGFNNRNMVLPQTTMRRVTVPIDLLLEANDARARPRVIGTVQCSVASPCWQLPVTRIPGDAARLKPTSVVVQSSKGGSATRVAINEPGF